MTNGQFLDKEGTFLMGHQVKFMKILDLLKIVAQIHPVFTRKHMTAHMTHKYHDENRE